MKLPIRTTHCRRSAPPLRVESLEARDVPALVGALDPSFGTGGTTTLDLGGTDRAAAVAVQPDGKIVVVGQDVGGDFAVARFNATGSPDTTFGNGNGHVSFDLGGVDVATSVAIQADGKIVVAGYTDAAGTNDMAVIRVSADGKGLDTTFDTDGIQTVAFDIGGAKDDRANAVAIEPNGKIVLVGSDQYATTDNDLAVARLLPDGTPDAAFGSGAGRGAIGGGKLFVYFDQGGGLEDKASSVAIEPSSGKIVIAGYAQVSATGYDFAVARLNEPDGSPDTAFGGTGQLTVPFSTGGANNNRATGVALEPNGDVVVVGTVQASGSDYAFAAARLKQGDGKLDTDFNSTGQRTFDFNVGGGRTDRAAGVVVQRDGKIVVVGSTQAGTADFVALRLNPADGSLDNSFGTGGRLTVDYGGTDAAAAVAIQPNGRIVIAGTGGAGGDFALARIIGTVEEPQGVAASGGPDGTAATFRPNFTTGQLADAGLTINLGTAFGVNARVATGDVDGDGFADTILVTGPGTPVRVAVVSGQDNRSVLVGPLDPFGGDFTGGGFVSAGDFDNDGRAEVVVTPDQGGGPRVVVFALTAPGTFTQRANFFGIDDPDFRGGARTGIGDVNADGTADLAVAAGFQGGPRVAVYNGRPGFVRPTKLVNDFFAFEDVLRNGVYVAIGDVNGDGYGDLIFGAGPGGGPRVLTVSGQKLMAGGAAAVAFPLSNFLLNGFTADRGGVRVATADTDGDNRAEVVVGTGAGSLSRVRVYLGRTFGGSGEPRTYQELDPLASAGLLDGTFVG